MKCKCIPCTKRTIFICRLNFCHLLINIIRAFPGCQICQAPKNKIKISFVVLKYCSARYWYCDKSSFWNFLRCMMFKFLKFDVLWCFTLGGVYVLKLWPIVTFLHYVTFTFWHSYVKWCSVMWRLHWAMLCFVAVSDIFMYSMMHSWDLAELVDEFRRVCVRDRSEFVD